MPMTQDHWADFFAAVEMLNNKEKGYYDRCVDAIYKHWTSIVFSPDVAKDMNIAEDIVNQLLKAWRSMPPSTNTILKRFKTLYQHEKLIRQRLKRRIEEMKLARPENITKAQYISEQYTERMKKVESELENLRKIEEDAKGVATHANTLEQQSSYLDPQSVKNTVATLQNRAENLQKSANQSLSSLVQKCAKEGQPPVCEAIPAAKKHADTAQQHIQQAQQTLGRITQSVQPRRHEPRPIIPKPPEVSAYEWGRRELPSIQQPMISIAAAPEAAPSPPVSPPPQGVAPPLETLPASVSIPSPPSVPSLEMQPPLVTAPVPILLKDLESDLKNANVQREAIEIIMQKLTKEEDMWDSFLMAVDILSDISKIVNSISDKKRKEKIMNELYDMLRNVPNSLKQVGEKLSQLFTPNESARKSVHQVALELSMLKKNNIEKRAQATAKRRPRIVANALQEKWNDLKDGYFLTIVDRLSNAGIKINDETARDLTKSVMQKTWKTLLPSQYTETEMPKTEFDDDNTVDQAKKKLEQEKGKREEISELLGTEMVGA